MTLFRILKNRLGMHPNIVQIYDVYFEESPYYISMEDVGGLDLGKWFERHCADIQVDEGVRLEIIAKVADALHAAHDAGVIHRDVKPSNILVEGNPQDSTDFNIKLTDFGIGRLESKEALFDITSLGFTETFRPTELASGSGSRLYMAPELLVGKESSIRSDVFALGIVLYQLLLGDFNRPLTVDWERDIEDPILLEDLRGCLSGRPSERLNSAEDLAIRLRSLGERRASRARDLLRSRGEARRKSLLRGVTGVAALAALLAAFLGYGLWQASVERENLEHSLYQLSIEEARRSIEDLDSARAREIIFASQERFRGWEWGYLACKCNTDHRAFSHPSTIVTLDLSSDNRVLATGDSNGMVKVWDFETGKAVWEIQSTSRSIEAVSINHESTKIALSQANLIEVWNLETRKQLANFRPTHTYHGGIRFAPSQDLLAAADSGGQMLLYNLSADSTREIHTGHAGRISDFDFLPDGQLIITAGEDAYCHLLNIQTGQIRARVRASSGDLRALAVGPDGKRFAVLSGRNVYMGGIEPFELAYSDYLVPAKGGDLEFDPGGLCLGLAMDNHRVGIIDLSAMGAMVIRGGAGGQSRSLAFTRDRKFLLTVDEDGKARQRPVRNGEDGILNLTGHTAWVHCVAFSPDGKVLATGSEDMTVSFWDTQTGLERKHLLAYSGVQCFAWAPDGAKLGAGTDSGEVFLWDVASGEALLHFRAHEGKVMAIDFHPRGESFTTKGSQGEVVVWSAEKGDQILRLESGQDEALRYSPDGEALLSTGKDFTVQEWSSRTGELSRTLKGHERPIRKVAFFPDGNRIASVDEEGGVVIWARDTGEKTASFKSRVSLTHELIVCSEGRRLITSVEIWDLENLRPIIPLPVDEKDLSSDGKLLAVGGTQHRVRIEGAFPHRDRDLSTQAGLPLEEKVEAYKREYWRKRPGTATGVISPGFQPEKEETGIVGNWNFDRGDLTATVGRDLEFFGPQTKRTTIFGTTREFGVPSIEDKPALVLRIPGFSKETGLRLFSNASQQGDNKLQAYTLILDLLYPVESKGLTRPIYNTDSSNSSPAELVVSSTGGLGVDGVFHGAIQVGKWHRVACSVNLAGVPKMDKFIDGDHVGTQLLKTAELDRWAVAEGRRGRSMLLLAGRDADDAPCFVNSIQFRDLALSDEEVAGLGGPSATGIPFE